MLEREGVEPLAFRGGSVGRAVDIGWKESGLIPACSTPGEDPCSTCHLRETLAPEPPCVSISICVGFTLPTFPCSKVYTFKLYGYMPYFCTFSIQHSQSSLHLFSSLLLFHASLLPTLFLRPQAQKSFKFCTQQLGSFSSEIVCCGVDQIGQVCRRYFWLLDLILFHHTSKTEVYEHLSFEVCSQNLVLSKKIRAMGIERIALLMGHSPLFSEATHPVISFINPFLAPIIYRGP